MLPAPEPSSASASLTPPQNPLQAQLLALYEEVLNSRPLGIEDNFFERGGHSLAAVRLVSMVRSRLGVCCGLRVGFGLLYYSRNFRDLHFVVLEMLLELQRI